jgi:hypothetical protein
LFFCFIHSFKDNPLMLWMGKFISAYFDAPLFPIQY